MSDLKPLLVVLMLAPALLAGQREDSRNVVPELAGAERVTGSILVDGELPAPYIDYIVTLGPEQTQKLSLYQNGLVTMAVRVGTHKTVKQVLFPVQAIDAYREHLHVRALRSITIQPQIATPTAMREIIRIYDQEGKHVERSFDPSLYLPAELERMRLLLLDLARVITEDNEVTNPMSDYVPEAKDRLLDQQMTEWVVVRVVNDHVELQSSSRPLRVWVRTNQLDEQFLSWSRGSTSPRSE